MPGPFLAPGLAGEDRGLSELDVAKCNLHFPVGAAVVTVKQRRQGKSLELPLGANMVIN